jgi:hypothetical protein
MLLLPFIVFEFILVSEYSQTKINKLYSDKQVFLNNFKNMAKCICFGWQWALLVFRLDGFKDDKKGRMRRKSAKIS